MIQIAHPSVVFAKPESIFFAPYLLCALAITIAVLVIGKRQSLKQAFRTYFAPDIWLTKSARTDLIVSVVYLLVFDLPTASLQFMMATETFDALKLWMTPLRTDWALPTAFEVALASMTVVLCFDLATYLAHRLMHRIPVLWDIHAVHHSPETLNVFSAYRQHPFDRLIRNSLGALFTACGMATLHTLLPTGTTSATAMGLGIGFFAFMLTVNLQHSHVPVRYPGLLGKLFLSPHLHQLHHSSAAQHRDRNFGGIFPYWDRLFGTYHDERVEIGSLKFGLFDESGEDPIKHSVWRCYAYPFISIAKRLRRSVTHI